MKKYLLIIISIILISSCTEKSNNHTKNKVDINQFDFDFHGYDLCINDEASYHDSTRKYGIKKPYNITKGKSGDTLIYYYKMIDECCLTPSGKLEVLADLVFLKGYNKGNQPCDCYCSYDYYFYLSNKIYGNKKIIIKDEQNEKKVENDSILQSLKGTWTLYNHKDSLILSIQDSNILYLIDKSKNEIIGKTMLSPLKMEKEQIIMPNAYYYYVSSLDINNKVITEARIDKLTVEKDVISFNGGGSFKYWIPWTLDRGIYYKKSLEVDVKVEELQYSKVYFK